MFMRRAIFYCQRLLPERERILLESTYKDTLFLFPMPCSGRIQVTHLLKALEVHSDAVAVITCPLGQCRYQDGNLWVTKRVDRARTLLSSIGIEPERLMLLRNSALDFNALVKEVMESTKALTGLNWHNHTGEDR
jgi:coenzyme F420-reducing hydrogenase delta subunit